VVEPVKEVEALMKRMAGNDFTTTVVGNYKGEFDNLKNATNEVRDRLLRVQEVIQNIAAGDLRDLDDLKQIGNGTGRRSENDNLVPSFIRMIESIKELTTETEMLTEAIVEGKLDVRGDVSKLKGDYARVLEGVNDVVDAVVGPVREIIRVSNALAKGNLSERIEIEAKGEFLELAESLNMATGNLSDLIAELQGAIQNVASIGNESASSVEQVNSGMQQISSASQQIAKGAQETSSTVNESAKEIKETNAMLQQVQASAEESNKFAVESTESAEEMNELTKKSVEGMKQIQAAIGSAAKVIESLGNSIDEIGKTTDMIEGIADQTNLLALNAAIEAARAGEHGRGFAVVAEEVRKLAENSKKSTAEIDTMIKTLQKEMDKVTKASETVMQHAEVGREDLEKAVASVEKTAGMIENIKNRMEQITEGVRKGTESMEKVSRGVDEIASSAEESASSSEESSSAVEQQTAAIEQLSTGIQKLSEISDQATQMIGKFKLQENGGKKQE
ncbi:MAG: methyl-accepting chemotaxis protein, partial [Candidatus Methanospirareceae archaeon]